MSASRPTTVPADVSGRRAGHPRALGSIARNLGWLSVEQALRVAVGLTVGIWLAKYLGPERFGTLNFALSLAALCSAFAFQGLNTVLVRDQIERPDGDAETLATALLLRAIGGLVTFAIALAAMTALRPGDVESLALVALCSGAVLVQAGTVARSWFEARSRLPCAVRAEALAFVAVAAVKVALIYADAPLIAFGWAIFLEAVLATVGLAITLSRQRISMAPWHATVRRLVQMWRDAWPLVLSSFTIMVYMRIDQIMIASLAGDRAVGVYAAASKLSEFSHALPLVVVAAVVPSILEARATSEAEYSARWAVLLGRLATAAIAIAAAVAIAARPLVSMLFGEGYDEAADVLRIHVWTLVLVSLGTVSHRWYVSEGLQRLEMTWIAIAALVNVGLNAVLIPAYGARGAAVAMVLSMMLSALLLDACSARSRPLFFAKLRALVSGPRAVVVRLRASIGALER
jgi:PST family polysaccharide transporter